MIEPKDMDRLVTEITLRLQSFTNDDRSEISVWLEDAGISEEAYQHIAEQMVGVLVNALSDDEFVYPPTEESIKEVKGNIEATLMMAFALGWEARDQYGN